MTDTTAPLASEIMDQDDALRRDKARRMITYLILFAIVMFFAGLTSAYVVTRSSVPYWVQIVVPSAFYISTASILVSSVFVHLAMVRVRSGRAQQAGPLLMIALVLGLVFTWSQFQGWAQLRALGQIFSFSNVMQPTGVYGQDFTITKGDQVLQQVDGQYYMPDDMQHAKPLNADMQEQANAASQYFYALTFAHLAHLFFGLIALLVMAVAAMRGKYTAAAHTGLWSGALYWHFLGGLWVYLLLFLAIIH